MSKAGRPTQRGGFLLLLSFIVLALNLRSPLTAISPVIGDLRTDLGIGSAMASLLTSIPVLCFGLLTPLASTFIARTSIETSIFVTLGGIALGTVIRSIDGLAGALAGTTIIGAAMTIGNIVSLMVIARDFPRRAHAVTGLYTSALNVGTMLTSAFTAPLAVLFGWRIALAFWIVLAVLAIALWTLSVFLRREPSADKTNETPPIPPSVAVAAMSRTSEVSVWRRPIAWLLVLAFASHVFVYYGLTAWLPAYLIQTEGMAPTTAGFAASTFQILALLGSFGVPALAATKRISGAMLLIGVAITWIITPIGFLVAPDQWFLWSLFGGIASGGGFTAVFMLVMDHTVSLADNRRMSSLVQGMGYALAAAGPFVVGAMHQATEAWTVGFLFLAGVALLMVITGIGVAKCRLDPPQLMRNRG
jgi:CP family cyanate transporter-like MFS transporter